MHEVKFTNPKVAERVAAWKSTPSRLDLSDCGVTSDDLEQLGCDDVVTSRASLLLLRGNPAEQWIDGIHSLARFKRFRGIQLKGCDLGLVRDVGRRLGDGLKGCKDFSVLMAAFNELRAEQLSQLFERLPSLGIMDLSGNNFLELTELAVAMGHLTRLGSLSIGFNPFERIAPLVSTGVLRHLSRLNLWQCENLCDVESLAPLASDKGGQLRYVDLRGCTTWAERLCKEPGLQLCGGDNSERWPLFAICE